MMTSRESSSSQSSHSSVQESYRIADSDSDDEVDTIEQSAAIQSKELNEIKTLSNNLMDEEWKRNRDRKLLKTMLELDEPAISPKMVDFLLHEGVSDMLLEFVTQIGTRPRPSPNEAVPVELKYSYRVVSILCVDQPSDHLLGFLTRRVISITRAMFDVFREDSAGSFHHAARILEALLRVLPSEVYLAIVSDGLLEDRLRRVLRYIGYPPVGDLLVILIGLNPIPRSSPLYASASSSRWKFFEGLSEWIFLLRLAEIVVNPSCTCVTREYVTSDQHCSAAAQTLSEIIDKLSNDDIGEILLQPLGHTPVLLESLITCGTTSLSEDDPEDAIALTSRRASLRFLCFLLKKSSNENNVLYVSSGGNTPVPTTIPNRLYKLRPQIVDYFLDNISLLETALLDTTSSYNTTPIIHPGHICTTPFSAYRSQLVELLVLIIEASPPIAQNLSSNLWKVLISWNFEYVHNNIYHSSFYKLMFSILRQNDEPTIKNIFKVSKLTTQLLDAFDFENLDSNIYFSAPDPGAASRCTLSPTEKKSLRGFVINLANAIRLQVSSLPPSSFLRQFLHSHQKWNEFLPILRAITINQQSAGMGFAIPTAESGSSISHLTSLLAGASLTPEDKEGIDHGSSYAKSLGFDIEMDWPEEEVEIVKKKKKNKKKKKTQKKKNNSGSEDVDEDDENIETLEYESADSDSRDSGESSSSSHSSEEIK